MAIIIMLIIGLILLAIFGGVGWYFLLSLGMTTAFVGFCAGMIFILVLANMSKGTKRYTEEGPMAFGKYLFLPFICGAVGWFLEYFKIWRIGLAAVEIIPKEFTGTEALVLPINIVLTAVVTVCAVAQTIAVYKRHRR